MRRDQIREKSCLVFPDTNVSVEYAQAIPEILWRRLKYNRRTYPNLIVYLDLSKSKNNLKICETVNKEFKGNDSKSAIEKSISRELKKNFPDDPHPTTRKIRFLNECTKRFDSLRENCMIRDDDRKLCDVKGMYDGIWNDSSQDANRKDWFKKKSRGKPWFKDRPPAGNDHVILSTIAHLREESGRLVEFITSDNDFLAFREKIREQFGVIVTAKYAFDPDNRNVRHNP